jgi:cell division protein FtsA
MTTADRRNHEANRRCHDTSTAKRTWIEARRTKVLKPNRKFDHNVVGLLDIGTSKVCCLIIVREPADGGDPTESTTRVLGIGHQRSRGVKAGVIVDLDEAEQAVRAAVGQAERMAGLRLDEVYVGVACGRLRSGHFVAHADLVKGVVEESDIRRLLVAGRAYAERDARTLLHCDRIAYRLDGVPGVRDPRGMAGRRLSADVHAVTADEAPLRNLLLLVERCYLTVAGIVPSPLASALAVTSEEERHLGVTCLDVGGGMTTLAVFADRHFLFADTVPVGGNHLTYDVARALRTPLAEAERIKTLYGTLVTASSDEHKAVSYPPAGEVEPASYQTTKAHLRNLLQERVENLLALVRERLEGSHAPAHAGERFVVTGGASQLVGFGEFAANVLGRPARVGRPQPLGGMPANLYGPAFSGVMGLVGAVQSHADYFVPSRDREAIASGYLARMGQWLRRGF